MFWFFFKYFTRSQIGHFLKSMANESFMHQNYFGLFFKFFYQILTSSSVTQLHQFFLFISYCKFVRREFLFCSNFSSLQHKSNAVTELRTDIDIEFSREIAGSKYKPNISWFFWGIHCYIGWKYIFMKAKSYEKSPNIFVNKKNHLLVPIHP